MWGLEGVSQVLEANAAREAGAIADALLEGASRFAGGHLSDDVAIVVIRRTPE